MKLMKPDCILVNVGRGGLIHTEELIGALTAAEHGPGFAALDV